MEGLPKGGPDQIGVIDAVTETATIKTAGNTKNTIHAVTVEVDQSGERVVI